MSLESVEIEEPIMKRFWIVMRAEATGSGPGFPKFKSRTEAEEDAKRMAVKNPGVAYAVLMACSYVTCPVPQMQSEEFED